jgi:hypothetical protein
MHGAKIQKAFHSFIRNFGYAGLTSHSEMKRKVTFSFAFRTFIRTFVAE